MCSASLTNLLPKYEKSSKWCVAELTCWFIPSSGWTLFYCCSVSSSNQPGSTVPTSFPLWSGRSSWQDHCGCWWRHTVGSELHESQPVNNWSMKQTERPKHDRDQCFDLRFIIPHSKYSLLWSYLLWVRVRFLVPGWGRGASSETRRAKVLYLAKVSQYGASGTIHPVKRITGVWLPTGLQKLPKRLVLNLNNDDLYVTAHIFGYLQQFIMQIDL